MGDTLGHYQLLAQVGSGGMGRVWAARQVGALQRLVAIKTALTEGAQTAEFERVFLDEARIASLIHHPHVCGVYELGEQDGVLYLVMEWSDGGTLLEVLKRQPQARMDATLAAAIVAKVCAGLHAAHELEDEFGERLNVVHRDVTPQNILLSSQGHVRLADFGVAKAQGQMHRPTETGEVKGKLNYMAPEQLTSKNLDRRVDLFALGCVLYECTVGRRPFQGDGALSTLYLILEQEVVSPCELVPEYSEGLASIVLKALSKQADERYQTAEEMQKDLEAWLIGQGAQVSETDIALLVNEALGETIRSRAELIELAIERFDSRGEEPQHAGASDASAEVSSTQSSAPGVSASSRGAGSARVSPMTWMLGVGVAAVLGGVFVAQARNDHDSVATVTGANAPANAPERVRVVLRTDPADATIIVDNGPPRDAPFTAEVDASELPRTVRVNAPGYRERVEVLKFDQSQELMLRLQREPDQGPLATNEAAQAKQKEAAESRGKSEPPPASTSKTSRPDTKPRPALGAPVAEPQTTQAPVNTTTEPKRGKLRVLDTDNPF